LVSKRWYGAFWRCREPMRTGSTWSASQPALVQDEKAIAVSSSEHSIFWPRPVRWRS